MFLRLFVSQMAVSLGETFSGPNGFSSTASSSNRCCCISCALNSSTPSKASARCWYDEVSNLLHCLQESECEQWPADNNAPVVLLCFEHSLPFCRLPSGFWTVYISFVIKRSPPVSEDAVDGVFRMGNSTILSILGAFTDTSRESRL